MNTDVDVVKNRLCTEKSPESRFFADHIDLKFGKTSYPNNVRSTSARSNPVMALKEDRQFVVKRMH
jgi:hypothetical protein